MRTEGEYQQGCYTRNASTMRRIMALGQRRIFWVFLVVVALAPLVAARVRQQAGGVAKKIVQIQQQGEVARGATARRTPVTQDEVNSWFTYRAQPMLPAGVSQPQVTIVGQGKVEGQATVDLEALGKRRSSGGAFDPW